MDSSLYTNAQPSSESLMLAYAAGDADAFTQLYNLHKGPLFRFILRQGATKARADEVFQEIWLKIIKARESYQSSARFQTWLYTIARNHMIDEFRKEGKAELTEFTESHNLELTEEIKYLSSEDSVDKERQQQHLLSSVKALPFEQRQAFLLRYEAGMNSADIAEITGTNQETAKSRVRYAIKQLRIKLGGSQ